MNLEAYRQVIRSRAAGLPASALVLGAAFGSAMFLLDLSVPHLMVGGIPYVILVLLSFWLPWRYAPASMALIGTVLAVAASPLSSPVAADRDLAVVKLCLDVLVLWVAAYLVHRHRASHESLKNPEGRLRALVRTAVDGVIIMDSKGIVQEFNPACEEIFGYRARDVIGENVSMLMPAPYRDQHDSYLARYGKTGERRIIGIGREVEGQRRDGTTFPLELSVGEARHGDEQSFVGIIRDITARKAVEKSLQTAKEQAESASQAKSLFLANMSHEIRTPMNAVLGYTQILENDPVFPERHRQALKAIDRAGNHLLGVINQILDLSKIEAGAMELDVGDFDLDELVEAISAMFKSRCEQKGLTWTVESRIDCGTVRGDQGKLRQVLINLLGNAVKFTDWGNVRLRVSQTQDAYRFEVTDTGSGITPAAREWVFEPFHQADEGILKGGTGLGLTLSKRQVEVMGGDLEVTSEAGGGSRFAFEVVLPSAEGPIAPASLTGERIIGLAAGSQVNALVVDDIADNRELLARMLRTVGVNVWVARNGIDALKRTITCQPDIVFMDVRMPVMDGTEALRRIRAEAGDGRIACVAMSAAGWSHEADQYLEIGFDDFVAKPYRFETVCECIEEHLDVRFEREAVEPATAGRVGSTVDLPALGLPEPLRQRLLRAARLNAFTEIEAALVELKGLGERERELEEILRGFLQRYDSRSIAEAMEQLGSQPNADQ